MVVSAVGVRQCSIQKIKFKAVLARIAFEASVQLGFEAEIPLVTPIGALVLRLIIIGSEKSRYTLIVRGLWS